MVLTEGEKWINNLKRKWVLFSFVEAVLLSIAVSLVIVVLVTQLFDVTIWICIPVFLAILTIVTLVKQYWKISSFDVSRYLNNRFPELEESTSLILKPVDSLSYLQQLQVEKVTHALHELPPPNDHVKKLKQVALFLLAGIIVSVVIVKVPWNSNGFAAETQENGFIPNTVKENILPQIASVIVSINPPAYTGNPERKQRQFTVKAEYGATVKWNIKTNKAVGKLELIFNDKERVALKPANSDSTLWLTSRTIDKPGYYQLNLDGKLSDLYQVEVISDQPVVIKITDPKVQHSTIDYGQPEKVSIAVSMLDDYSITKSYISATMASGKGESVSFKEQQIAFNNSPNNSKQFQTQKTLDLKALGMIPGDELYFFVKAFDNHGQESRSDIYFVSIQDTAELMTMTGITNGVAVTPEYFSSQRQIIIDTEKLLKEQSTISVEEFNNRSNNIGIDQKLLRMRYAEFLGEEAENSIGAEPTGDDHAANPVFGNTDELMEEFTHHADNSEESTFLEPVLKAQLKAVVTEMWNSELRLRTFKPKDALPFEYKALRLLKDLQQNSRAFVAKTTVKTTPLKLEKRLSGELDKIQETVKKGSFEQTDNKVYELKSTLTLLESLKTGAKIKEADRQLLMNSEKYMISAAAQNPVAYLSALKAMKKLTSLDKASKEDIALAEQGIKKLAGAEKSTPQVYSGAPASKLSQAYFKNLKNLNK